MPNVKIWLRVPDGSTFEAWASGTTGNWEIVVDIDSDSGEETEWDRGKLSPGPAQFTVHAPHRYTVRIDVEVAGKPPAAVTFTARILKPGGTQFGDAFSFTTPAQEGSYLATLGIVTEAP